MAPGAKLILPAEAPWPNMFEDEFLCTVEGRAKSGRLLPDDERWKEGCGGRPGASDILEEDIDRP